MEQARKQCKHLCKKIKSSNARLMHSPIQISYFVTCDLKILTIIINILLAGLKMNSRQCQVKDKVVVKSSAQAAAALAGVGATGKGWIVKVSTQAFLLCE